MNKETIPSQGESGLWASIGAIVAYLAGYGWKQLTGEELPDIVFGAIVTAVTLGGMKYFGRGLAEKKEEQ